MTRLGIYGWQVRIKQAVVQWWGRHARVTPVAVGRKDDGLVLRPAGTPIDKPWHELSQEFQDAREAWRRNPLARRLVGLITSYTVGNGITLQSEKRDVQRFITDFWQHNQLSR